MNETFFQPSFSCVYVQFSLSTRSDMIFHPDQTPDIGTPSGASQQARVLSSGLSFCFFRASHVWLRTHVLYSRLHQPQKKTRLDFYYDRIPQNAIFFILLFVIRIILPNHGDQVVTLVVVAHTQLFVVCTSREAAHKKSARLKSC